MHVTQTVAMQPIGEERWRGCLLVPFDGWTVSKRALPYAVALANASKQTLHLLRVLTPQPPRGEALVQESAAMAGREQIARGLRGESLDVEVETSSTIFGEVAEVIVGTAQRSGAELIVMSTHGRGGLGRWVYWSVAERVLHLATTPVFLVPALCGRTWPADRRPRILLTFDGSLLAGLAVEAARNWAQLIGADVVLVRVVPPASNDDHSDDLLGHQNGTQEQPNEEPRRARETEVLVARQIEPVRRVPHRPDDSHHEGGSRHGMATLQVRQRKAAPARLLAEAESDDPQQKRCSRTDFAQEVHLPHATEVWP
jgi:nucleotide-binding universal stress UspA family protein